MLLARLVEQPRFRAGFDFLRLRADTGELPDELAEWWEDFSLGTDEERRALLDDVRAQQQPRRVPGSGRGGARTAAPARAEPGDEGGYAPAAKKRRRRRRRPAGDTAAPAPAEADEG